MAAKQCTRHHAWCELAELGADTRLVIRKVKAHQCRPDASATDYERFVWQGNKHADDEAKSALPWHACRGHRAAAEHMCVLARWAGVQGELLTKQLRSDTSSWPEEWRKMETPSLRGQRRRSPKCERENRRKVDSVPRAELLVSTAFPWHKLGALGPGHSLQYLRWEKQDTGCQGFLLACKLCGAYCESRLGALRQPCAEHLSRGRQQQLARIARRLHPLMDRARRHLTLDLVLEVSEDEIRIECAIPSAFDFSGCASNGAPCQKDVQGSCSVCCCASQRNRTSSASTSCSAFAFECGLESMRATPSLDLEEKSGATVCISRGARIAPLSRFFPTQASS
eukprot:6472001-Amphidinium_carterae.2